MSGKELNQVALDKNGKTVGALWTEVAGDSFSFDIAVNESNRRQGIADALLSNAFDEFEFQNDGRPDEDALEYEVYVVNPAM